MRDTVHLEGIQPDLPWHLVSLAPAGYGTCTVGHYGRRNEISTRWTRMNCARGRCRLKTKAKRVCMDSPLEGDGFEPSVPRRKRKVCSERKRFQPVTVEDVGPRKSLFSGSGGRDQLSEA